MFFQNILRWVIIVISMIFIAGGAVNNGSTWFLMAIPFAVVFAFAIRPFSQTQKHLLVACLIALCLPLAWKHSENKLLYPYLGSRVEFLPGWGYEKYGSEEYFSLVDPESVSFRMEYPKQYEDKNWSDLKLVSSESSHMRMVVMEVSHADLGIHLQPVFEDERGMRYTLGAHELSKELKLGTVKSEDLKDTTRLQSEWSFWLGRLMWYPSLPFMALKHITDFFWLGSMS
jgi:hypothetical protein